MTRKTFSESFSKTFSRGVSFALSGQCKSLLLLLEKSHNLEPQNGRESPDSDPRLQLKPFVYRGLVGVRGESFNEIFNGFNSRSLSGTHTAHTRRLPGCESKSASYPYKMKALDMMQRYRKFKRSWGMWYAFDNVTGNSVSLKTRVKGEAEQKIAAMNETERQPSISLGLAKVYLNATDPKLATRTWQEVMEHVVAKKKDETRRRWDTAIKDANFDCIRNLCVAETRPEHFDRALADGKVSTNVYLRRIHNHALGMEWLLKSVIPRLQWPKPVFKDKRAITAEEHAAIVAREMNAERRDFYELLWHTGAAQSDGACLRVDDINWNERTICFTRKKLKSRGTSIKPTLFRFSADVEAILKRRPQTRGFTAAVSVFRGTPPPKPLKCKFVSNQIGARLRSRWADHPTRGIPRHSCALIRLALSDIIETSLCYCSQTVHLSLPSFTVRFRETKKPCLHGVSRV